jgi:hypothetical protein
MIATVVAKKNANRTSFLGDRRGVCTPDLQLHCNTGNSLDEAARKFESAEFTLV